MGRSIDDLYLCIPKVLSQINKMRFASAPYTTAHARFLVEDIVSGGNALTVRISSRGTGGRAVDVCTLRATDSGVGASGRLKVLVELAAEALLAH